jgi:cytidylate kinase
VVALIIAISGLHGVGKSVYAREVAKRYGLRYISSGMIFRQLARERGLSIKELTDLASKSDELDRYIDETMVREARKGNVVADGLLTGWMLKDIADLKFWFKARDEVRFRRIAERDGVSYEEAASQTLYRERSEIERFKRYYGIDLNNLSIYDYVIDTSFLTIEEVLDIIFKIIDGYISRRGGR